MTGPRKVQSKKKISLVSHLKAWEKSRSSAIGVGHTVKKTYSPSKWHKLLKIRIDKIRERRNFFWEDHFREGGYSSSSKRGESQPTFIRIAFSRKNTTQRKIVTIFKHLLPFSKEQKSKYWLSMILCKTDHLLLSPPPFFFLASNL